MMALKVAQNVENHVIVTWVGNLLWLAGRHRGLKFNVFVEERANGLDQPMFAKDLAVLSRQIFLS